MPPLYVKQGSTKTEQTSAEPETESAPAVESRETERIEVRGDVQLYLCVVHLVRVVQIEVRHRHRWTFLASY